jgi:ubiquinone/menaquinone biosynthesis C-methylase UbiE
MHAHTVAAAEWWARPRGASSANWIANYQRSLQARHRTQIAAIIETLRPTTILEVGAHCGPNLVRLAQQYPWIEQLSGIDVNTEAIAAGQQWVTQLGLSERIELTHGRVPGLTEGLSTGCVDLVLSCYALAYIAPPDLDATLWEMGRLARRAVLLAEPYVTTGTAQWNGAMTGYREWAHDYRAAAPWLSTWRDLTIRIDPVEPPVDRLNGILVAVRDPACSRSETATP